MVCPWVALAAARTTMPEVCVSSWRKVNDAYCGGTQLRYRRAGARARIVAAATSNSATKWSGVFMVGPNALQRVGDPPPQPAQRAVARC